MKISVLLLLTIVAIASGTYTPRTRDYYIAAIEVDWDYVPTGQDLVWGGQYGEFEEFSMRTMYRKAVYREFTDATFTTRMFRGSDEQHLGILGPNIRGVVGDTLRIHFMNMASFPFSITSEGVAVDKANEGAVYIDSSTGVDMQDDEVQPGDNFTYIWHVPESSGPLGDDVSSIAYPYHSLVNEINDLNSGLFGSVIITRADKADPETARPTDVDREFVVLFHAFNEELSLYNEVNGINASSPEGDIEKNAMNGLIFGNLRGLNTTINETVRWYVMGAGFFHVPSWHGNTLIWDNRRVVSVIVGPGVALTLTQRELNAGTWLFYCHVEEHALEGMATTYTVSE